MVVDHVPQQLRVGAGVELEEVVVDAVERVAERRREVLLVAEQHVDGLDEAGVDLGRAPGAARGRPQRRAVVEVERDDRPVPARGLHRLERQRRRVRAESAPKTPPQWNQRAPSAPKIRSQSTSPGRSLRCGGVAAVGAAERGADAEAAFGEVEPVADLAADAVVREPAEVRLLDAALVDQILDQPPDGVVGQRRSRSPCAGRSSA